MGDSPLIVVCAFALGAATGILPWVQLYFSRRDQHRAEQRQAAAEAHEAVSKAELEALKRRSLDNVPFLAVSGEDFGWVHAEGEQQGEKFGGFAGAPQLLCFNREQVERNLAPGEWVVLVLENQGAEADQMSMTLDGENVLMRRNEREGAEWLILFAYPYFPEMHGKEQTVQLRFLARDARIETHRYITIHGCRSLRRVDPV
jgi:hypothetical protein